jgi:DNA-binding GntR family transcriptional regulator
VALTARAALGKRYGQEEKVADQNARSVVEMLFDAMRKQIVDGGFAPGQRLIEADLTQQFQVSRGPLREAVRRLASEGLVEILHNRGARVKRLSHAEVLALYEVREVLEGLAARLAAERATAEERGAVQTLIEEMSLAADSRNFRAYVGMNSRLHAMLVDAARNPTLAEGIKRLQTPVLRIQFEALMTQEVILASHAEHRDIAAAVVGRDGVGAEAAMRVHIQRSRGMIERRPAEEFA